MPEPALLGACSSCGTTYRVPSAARTYPCEECGGTVRVTASRQGPEDAGTDPPAPPKTTAGRPRSVSGGGRSRRRPRERKMAVGWLALAGFVALLFVGFKVARVVGAVTAGASRQETVEPAVPLLDRADAFRDAWRTGDAEELTPFFRPARSGEMVDLVRKLADRYWDGELPSVGPAHVQGRRDVYRAGTKVDVLHGLPAGDLKVRWILDRDLEEWVVIGFGVD